MTGLIDQPIATLLASALVLIGAALTVAQKRRADLRDQWWKRAQWALDLKHDPDRKVMAYSVLEYLAVSRLAGKEEWLLLEAAWQDDLPERGDAESATRDAVDEAEYE